MERAKLLLLGLPVLAGAAWIGFFTMLIHKALQ